MVFAQRYGTTYYTNNKKVTDGTQFYENNNLNDHNAKRKKFYIIYLKNLMGRVRTRQSV